jgi:beta-N-acetylhexosaminidase
VAGLRRLADGCLLPGFTGTEPPDWLLRRLAGGLGGVTLFARNVRDPEQVAALTAQLRAERPDALIAIDEEGGDVTRLEAARGSSYPGNLALGVAGDLDLTRAVASALGADLAAAGVNLDLAPVADVNSNPDNPVIGVRSFGAEGRLVADHTVAFVEGLQSRGVAACVKHFPGHGDTAVDSHLALPVVADGEEALETALLPFRVPAWDANPATISRPILTGVLRERLGFRGLVVTDGLEMAAIQLTVGLASGAVRALAAGADAICVGGGLAGQEVVDLLAGALAEAVASDELSEERLAEASERVAAVARWAAAVRQPPSPLAGDGRGGGWARAGGTEERAVGLDAARLAVRSRGLEPLGRAPVVAELRPEPGMAVGVVPWGLAEVLAERDPSVTALRLDGEPGVDDVLAAAAGRPLVLVGRDLHRYRPHAAAVDAVLACRPDAVVVEMGLPAHPPAAARAYVATHGAGRVNALAAADLLRPEERETR